LGGKVEILFNKSQGLPTTHQFFNVHVRGVEEQDHPMNHRLREDDMNMVDSNILEVDGMDTVEEYFHPMNHLSEVEGMDMVNTDMWEDRAVELEVVERESEGVVLTRHWIGNGAARHR
jgi:hypothetical protein